MEDRTGIERRERPLRGWLLYKHVSTRPKPDSYENQRFVEIGRDNGLDILVINPDDLDLTVTREDRRSILLKGKSVEIPDFVIPRMGAATTYFSLAGLRQLERLGVTSFNSSQAVDTVKDKLYSHQILAQHHLPVPKTMLVKFPVDIDLVERTLGFPVVVKTLSGSQGSGVFLSESRSHFEDLMQLIEVSRGNMSLILQEFLPDSRGRDLRVFTVGARAVACMKRSSQDGSFKANFSRGGSVESHPITPEIAWLATETARVLDLDIGGIDLLFDGEHFKVCEANSSPGFRGMEQACDINIAQTIFDFVRIRMGVFF